MMLPGCKLLGCRPVRINPTKLLELRAACTRASSTAAASPLSLVMQSAPCVRALLQKEQSALGVLALPREEQTAWERFLPQFMFKSAIVANSDFNRWSVPVPAIATHLCIGSVYSWSLFNEPLTRELGVVASAAADWDLGMVVPVFSTSIVCLGCSAAVAGAWLEAVGPRLVGAVSAACWGSGFAVGAVGLYFHSLPLYRHRRTRTRDSQIALTSPIVQSRIRPHRGHSLYLGYGVLGGIGLGLGYVSPVSTLMRWFPDRKGLATGMAIMGLGGGAMVAAPMKRALLAHYFTAPDYLGPVENVVLSTTESGRRVAAVASEVVDVVVVTTSDIAKIGVAGL